MSCEEFCDYALKNGNSELLGNIQNRLTNNNNMYYIRIISKFYKLTVKTLFLQ